MSLASTLRRAAAPATLAIATAFTAANANAAEYGCYAPDKVPALQQQVVKNEGMVPVAARFTARSDTEYAQETIMMNPTSREGLKWAKYDDGTVCIYTKYRQLELIDNSKFNTTAFASIAGKTATQVEINQVLTNVAATKGQNPMYRAIATSPTNAARNLPTEYYEFMVGNPKTHEGGVLAANFNGQWLQNFTKQIPTPAEKPVKFGAIYTPVGADLLKGAIVAGADSGTTTVALVRN